MLAHHILDEMVVQQTRIKLVKLTAAQLAGSHPLESGIRERTGCSIVAVEREGAIILDISPSFILAKQDALYVCGTARAFERFYQEFTES